MGRLQKTCHREKEIRNLLITLKLSPSDRAGGEREVAGSRQHAPLACTSVRYEGEICPGVSQKGLAYREEAKYLSGNILTLIIHK